MALSMLLVNIISHAYYAIITYIGKLHGDYDMIDASKVRPFGSYIGLTYLKSIVNYITYFSTTHITFHGNRNECKQTLRNNNNVT